VGQLYPVGYYAVPVSAAAPLNVSPRAVYQMFPAANNVATVFTVQGTVPASIPGYIDVYVNGILQRTGPTGAVDYSLDNTGSSFVVTFTTAPQTMDILEAVY
jgi:hypothetical protein